MLSPPTHSIAIIVFFCFVLLPNLISSWRIENSGDNTLTAKSLSITKQLERRITPPNIADPDYYSPTAYGGHIHQPGNHGAVIFIAKIFPSTNPTQFESVAVPPLELKASYFLKENSIQEYIVPGDTQRSPYEQEVKIKLWGGGGGGCNGGRDEIVESIPEEEDDEGIVKFSEGAAGGYVEATFVLPVGDTLQVVVGGGGMSEGSLSNSLGGAGGYHGGLPGRSNLSSSGGGGGGGLTTVSWNHSVIAAAYGGDGGGSTSYCSAAGGAGGSLRGHPKDTGGYINFDLALSNDNGRKEEVICPGVPEIVTLSHDSATFTWNAGSRRHETSKDYYVQKYSVHLSEGTINEDADGIECSEDVEYKLHEHVQRDINVNKNATTHVNNLQSQSTYCISIEAFSIEGLSLGKQILQFVTKPTPVNEWIPVTVRQLDVSTVFELKNANNNGELDSISSSLCEYSSSIPTGRRGHSMTIINDNVYIFGGATSKCICELDASTQSKVCSSKNVYSDELWHYDPVTSIFTRLGKESQDDLWPRGREQHSMTALPNGNLVLIGGITSSHDNLEIGNEHSELLSDIWVMKDPHHLSSHVFSMNEDLPLELISGQVTSHVMDISLNDDNNEDMCINDLQVRIALNHTCINGIEYIKLTGPGTKGMPAHTSPQSRDYETKVCCC